MRIFPRGETIDLTTVIGQRSLNMAFLPKSWNGQRVVLDALLMRITLQIDTGAGITLNGALLSQILGNVQVMTKRETGPRINAGGLALRAVGYVDEPEHFDGHDPAALAAATADQARTVDIVVPFSMPNGIRAKDSALPAADIKQITYTPTPIGSLPWSGGGAGTYDNCLMTPVAICHLEDEEKEYARRFIQTYNDAALLDIRVPIHGRRIRSIILQVPSDSASGGTAVTGTDISCQALGLDQVPVGALRTAMLFDGNHNMASTVDPFVAGTAYCAAWPQREGVSGAKVKDNPIHDDEVLLRVAANTLTPLDQIVDTVEV